MSRYIDADAVEKIINDIRDCISVDGYWAILQRLEKIPTADAVEVVRCKDCIHNHEHETPFGSKFHICNINNLAFTQYADFYCAYGEGKEVEE